MITIKTIYALLLFTLISWSGGFAQAAGQNEVSDDELKQFASAYKQIHAINQEIQQIIFGAIQEEGMDVQRYTLIFQAKQNPDQQIDASEKEIEIFNKISRAIEKIQEEAQEEMEEKITDEGLTIERYQEIGIALQTNPDLQLKIQEYL